MAGSFLNQAKWVLKGTVVREAVKLLLRPALRWSPLSEVEPGFSIMVGVPTHLKHLLEVNLRFIAATDTSSLRRVHVIFDRRKRPEHDQLAAAATARFPDLPLVFHSYPAYAGKIIETANVSTFYNGMNCFTALRKIRTKYAILHDFDLFPLVPDHFTRVVDRMEAEQWRFTGAELTNFNGLTDEDNILGTWCLGMDVPWLRMNFHPIDIFHKMELIRGKWTTLDPFSSIQRNTPERGLVGAVDGVAYSHVGNLCATYMRYRSGQRVPFAWKLHYLWYLEALAGQDRLAEFTEAMQHSDDGILRLDDYKEDFSDVDPTCANVLRRELVRMDAFTHGTCREEVLAYIDAFRDFLIRAQHPMPDTSGQD